MKDNKVKEIEDLIYGRSVTTLMSIQFERLANKLIEDEDTANSARKGLALVYAIGAIDMASVTLSSYDRNVCSERVAAMLEMYERLLAGEGPDVE